METCAISRTVCSSYPDYSSFNPQFKLFFLKALCSYLLSTSMLLSLFSSLKFENNQHLECASQVRRYFTDVRHVSVQTACALVNVHTGRSAVVGLTWLTAALPWLLRLKVSSVLVPQLAPNRGRAADRGTDRLAVRSPRYLRLLSRD